LGDDVSQSRGFVWIFTGNFDVNQFGIALGAKLHVLLEPVIVSSVGSGAPLLYFLPILDSSSADHPANTCSDCIFENSV